MFAITVICLQDDVRFGYALYTLIQSTFQASGELMTDDHAQQSSLWQSMEQRLAQQHWPKPALYVVATPIGNLTDLTVRGWYALKLVDVIAAEDTRSSRPLLQAWGIETETMAAHRHNEREATAAILQRLQAGDRVALISDAGSPAISDPGGRLVQDIRIAGYEVVALPGPSACITALMSVGATSDEQPEFSFLGFLPSRTTGRIKTLQAWQNTRGCLVIYEAPHRLEALLRDMLTVFEPSRKISLARELTKRFEETVTLDLSDALQWLAADTHRDQGEYVIIVHSKGQVRESVDQDDPQWQSVQRQAWMTALLAQLSTRDAAKVMSQALGIAKDICYRQLLELSRSGNAGRDA